MNKNYLKYYNEAQDMAMMKKKLRRGKKIRIYGYLQRGILNLIMILVASLGSYLFYKLNPTNLFTDILNIMIILSIVILIAYYILFLVYYKRERGKKHSGTLTLDKKGIQDKTIDGIKTGLAWNQVESIVVGKYTVTLLTTTNMIVFLDKKYSENMIQEVEKYSPNIKVIDKKKKV